MVETARVLALVGFVIVAVFASSLLFSLFGIPPLTGLVSLFKFGFGTPGAFASTVGGMVPLLIMAVGLSVPFTARVWNIGGQGQFVIGSIVSTWVGLEFAKSAPPGVVILLALVSSFLGGAMWLVPPILMRIYRGINEVITTLMMNFVSVFLLDWLITGPMEGRQAIALNEPSSAPLPGYLMFPSLVPGTNIGLGLVFALFLAVAFFFLMKYTRLGYELRLIGQGVGAARYAGVAVERDMLIASLISGGIAGVAGMVQIFGATGVLLPQVFSDITTSYGYVGIPVALIASLNPIGIILSAFFFSGILTGAYGMELAYDIPIDVVTAVYGMVMFLAPLGFHIRFSKRKLRV